MKSLLATAALVAAALSIALAAAASAAINPLSYTTPLANFGPPDADGHAGGYISCPAGTKAVSAGGSGYLNSADTTFDGNGAFVTGYYGTLLADLRCVPAQQVQASTLASVTLHDNRSHWLGLHFASRALCPRGTIAYGGGGFFHRPSSAPTVQDDQPVSASTPLSDGSGWLFAGTLLDAGLAKDEEVTTSTHCLPRTEFGEIRSVTEIFAPAPDAPKSGGNFFPPLPIVFGAARCPAGFYAYAGGFAWSPAGHGGTDTSVMAAGDRGWFAMGRAFLPDARLSVTVQCVAIGGAKYIPTH
jgi:hypothetical protein